MSRAAGLVRRRVDPTDRRISTLVVTGAGRQAQQELGRLMDSCAALLAGCDLTDAELGTARDLRARLAATL